MHCWWVGWGGWVYAKNNAYFGYQTKTIPAQKFNFGMDRQINRLSNGQTGRKTHKLEDRNFVEPTINLVSHKMLFQINFGWKNVRLSWICRSSSICSSTSFLVRLPFVSRLPYYVCLPFYDYLSSWCLSFHFFRGNPVLKLIVPGGWMDGPGGK